MYNLTPTQWTKKHCPFKEFKSIETCIENKCEHVEMDNGKPYGCKLWMEYFKHKTEHENDS